MVHYTEILTKRQGKQGRKEGAVSEIPCIPDENGGKFFLCDYMKKARVVLRTFCGAFD